MTRRALLVGALGALVSPRLAAGSDYVIAPAYTALRNQILKLRPSEVGLTESHPGAFGVVMETGYSDAVATLVALADGTASLYLSNGGGVIGAGQHEAPARAAREVVATASSHLSLFAPAAQQPLPAREHTQFYVLTARGPLTAEAKEAELGDRRHRLAPVFFAAHKLLAAIRQHREQQQRR